MDSIKADVCESLKLNQNRLHEIELEDIQLAPLVQKNIYKTIAQIFTPDTAAVSEAEPKLFPIGDITCKGYWVEKTKELVLYVWLGKQSKAIIIPQNGWFLRSGITIH